jgi:hypothetical protein
LGWVEYTKKVIVRQEDFGTRSWICYRAFSAGIRGIFGLEGERRALSTICQGPAGVLMVHPGTPVPFAPYCPSFITTEGKHPRGIRDPDEVARLLGGVERKENWQGSFAQHKFKVLITAMLVENLEFQKL